MRIGGHYVTTAGVDREGRLIAISDPYLDSAESGAGSGRVLGPLPHPHPAAPPPDTAHNDAQNVSHDLFDVIPVAAPGGLWGLKDYAAQLGPDINNFFGQNSSDELDQEGHPVQPPFGPEPIVAVVDYVLEVSPCPLDADGDGFRPLCDNDCNDNDPNINPGATETCDSVDNNCDGQVDEGFPNLGSSCMVGVGACLATGTFVCSADGTTSVCDAVPGTPAAEDLFICDGIDNNCDGRIDEVFPQDGVTNVTGTRGPGAQDITLNWQGGQPTYTIYRSLSPANVIDPANIIGTAAVRTFVDPAAPGQGRVYYYEVTSSCSLTCPEICDGVDNDCDGLIDEAGAAAFCSVPNATPICVNGACDIGSCTSPFDDCDMSSGNGCESDLNVDPNNCSVCGTACSYANAVPVCVLGNCMMGNCHTGFDDCNLSDADGCEVNLNNDPNNCSTCGNACSFANASSTCIGGTCQLGPCLSGWDDCNQTASDGCEQDLFFDVNHCGACGNVCMLPNATPTCAAGSCQIASCNAPYMDCNQVATDGCEVDPSSDINNCGFCGNVCSFANASARCSNSQCTMGACDPNYWDINNDPADGCEYSCTFISPTDEPDPGFTDENCDGIDGDVTRALYVSPTGSNSNTGTDPTQAFLTISHAISVSSAAGRNQILVAEGQYQDTLSLRNGVGIYGNYTASFASRLPTIGLTEMQSNSTTAVTSINDSGPTVLEYLRIISAPATQPGDSSYGIVATSSSGLIVRRCNVISGNGDAGVHASSPGGTAASGGSGGRGDPGCEDSTEILCEQCPQPLGGFAGFSSCGGSGGQGGAPGRGPQNGLFGQNSGAGTPGGPGTLDGQGNWNTPMLHWGLNGANGLLGSNGIPGSPGYSSSGYTPSNAANGQDGRHGDGGGGGGGGGGGTNFCWSWGGGGGGGGGGGCGGSLADGGTSAGGSFAIYLWASNATIEDSVLETGRGGLGGRGGTGQSGGAGGMGGHSFDPAIPGSGNDYGGVFDQDDGSNSGRGGDGGAGGDGGHGGGGAGGPTIGIIRGGGSMPNLSSNIFILGSPGPGGTSNGIPGPTGLRTNVYTP